ncbi:transmembrane 220 family protein [Maribacter sp. 2210JD10-5]|uniref:transmembrane 220 family protein n=1 Tax=Maribacter sp. 2210JD10-5 TaxID=3386272 RepID=UPI0039BC7177
MNIFFKFLGFLFAVLFILGAIVQYNDPDSLQWILIYAVAAVISLLFALDKIGFLIPFVFGILGIIGFIYLYPTNFQGFDLNDGDIKTVELGREAFGLLIIAVVLLLFAFRIKKTSKVQIKS